MKKTTKPLIFLIIFVTLFLATLGMSLGFTLYSIGTPEVTIHEATIKNYRTTTDRYGNLYGAVDIDIDITVTKPAKFTIYIRGYKANSGNNKYIEVKTEIGKTYTYKVKNFNLGTVVVEDTIEDFTVTVTSHNVEKYTSILNYTGFAMIPVSLCSVGFAIYATIDLIKAKKHSN